MNGMPRYDTAYENAVAMVGVACEMFNGGNHTVDDDTLRRACDAANAACDAASIDRTFDEWWGFDDDDAPHENTHAHAANMIIAAYVLIGSAQCGCDAEMVAIDDACDAANNAADAAGLPHAFDDGRVSDWLDMIDASNDADGG